MNIKEIKFSVLMSVYCKERPEYFELAVKSIIEQTIKPTEIVIVKDGALGKELEEVCGKLLYAYPKNIRFVPLKENVGLGLALQKGVIECKYDLIARMDTDDISKPDRFEKQLKAFARNPNLAICGSFIEEFSSTPNCVDSIRKVPLDKDSIYLFAKKRNPFNHMTVMFRKQAVLEVGNYQPFHMLEDYYLWFRMILNKQEMMNISDSLVMARTGDDMFMRRGGLKYFMHEKKLYDMFLEKNYITEIQYAFIITIRLISRLLPNRLRSCLYSNFIRDNV